MGELRKVDNVLDRLPAAVAARIRAADDSVLVEYGEATDCAACHGFGFVRYDLPVAHPDFGRAQPCRACASQTAQARIKKLPRAFHDWTRETFMEWASGRGHDADYMKGMERLDCWLDLKFDPNDPEFGNDWLFITSARSGRGKTGLVIAMLKVLMERGFSGDFKIVGDVLDNIKATYSNHDAFKEGGESETAQMRAVDVLILDDLGAERATEWVVSDVLFPLIANRHANRKRTIITSNLTLAGLADHMGHERTAARIRERCGRGEWVINMDGLPDLREPKPARPAYR